ncbi:MAG: acyl-CoA dehydrogenase family protein [Deltaproteobacteria bacterium]|nr:acyl-CoA dehydrogenase family protein [Deltaproteobacteria bacterium]
MANFFGDNDDLRYYFEKGIDWEPLVEITERGYRSKDGFRNLEQALEFYRQIAEMVGELSATEIAPHAAEIDRHGVDFRDGEAVPPPRLAGIFEKLNGLELHSMCLPRELGGLNAPLILYFINAELLARADVSTMTHHSFHGGMAMAMLIFSIHEGSSKIDVENGTLLDTRFRNEIEEIARGEAWGCMDITEPNAGSDMAALRTIAEQDPDGNWFVTGQKIFITSGHGKYHFVIARTENASGDSSNPMAGLSGLSMFLVPAYEEDAQGNRKRIVTIDRIEEKLGHHGSVTASLSFDRAPAHLIGKRGEGFKYMLTLMNNARLGVGFESLGLCESAYRMAKEYAEQRVSMGKTIDRHEIIADYLEEMRTDIQAIRALAMHGAVHEELAQKLALVLKYQSEPGTASAKHLQEEADRHKAQARRVTPLLKYLAAEKAVDMSRRAVQIMGGVGYTKDYGAEKLLRDAMVMPIYEGTSQIQCLMAMKDCLGGIMKNPQDFVKRMAQVRWRTLSARDPLERHVAKIQSMSLAAQNYLITRTAAQKLKSLGDVPITDWFRALSKNWDPKRDFAIALLNAERLTRILADEAACELLLAQARKHPERREILERYVERAEPRCRYLLDEMTTMGQKMLQALDAGESARQSVA